MLNNNLINLNIRLISTSTICILGLKYTSQWPIIQNILHIFLILGLIPSYKSITTGIMLSALGGWILESSLKLYPKLGGTALANMIMCLLIFYLSIDWPISNLKSYFGRQSVLLVIHTLIIHIAIYYTSGFHVWDSGWFWSLCLLPIWGYIAIYISPHILHRK